MLAAPVTDTIKRVEGGFVIATLDRRMLYGAQTPQVFRRDLLLEAYEKRGDEPATDDTPGADEPADEQPADEQPADEQPADEQPTDEQPADELPANRCP